VVYRTTDHFATLLTYPNGATSALVSASADEAQFGADKMVEAGGQLNVIVPESGILTDYISDDDGYTWAAV